MTEDELIFHDLLMATHTVEAVEKARKEVIEKAADWFTNYLAEIGYPDDWIRDSKVQQKRNGKIQKSNGGIIKI